jgi:hypothetical protein
MKTNIDFETKTYLRRYGHFILGVPFNSSLRKHFNSIFLSTVMTLFNYFEIGPLLKKPQDKMAIPS